MPGILPMKVIKVGSGAQSRIAQACDRCRSKKIRCDDIRPCCSQCSSVGFECKTSDKLSRRAFPRGYTESLEERVRSLEQEVRELKDLLDSKDEKLDMLSRLHSRSPFGGSQSRRGSTAVSRASPDSPRQGSDSKAQSSRPDTFRVVRRSQPILDRERAEGHQQRISSTRSLVECFKARLQDQGRSTHDFDIDAFFSYNPTPQLASPRKASSTTEWSFPPRLESDQMINVFFQEWAPLFPILHRPTFLAHYDTATSDKSTVEDKYFMTQLNLVFCIAGSHNKDESIISQWEAQFARALQEFADESSLENIQCLCLATLYCLRKGDRASLTEFRTSATDVAKKFDLHKRVSGCSALVGEMRKRTFWTLYTLDSFAAACLGSPRALKNTDIDCDYPSDVDDEYVSEDGFESSPQGEATTLSSAIASFKVSRILARVLDQNYPIASNYDLTLQGLQDLSEELDHWWRELPQHLRLEFEQDKPSTKVINNRSPLLSLTYYYIRNLIYRPALFSDLGDKSSAAMLKLGAANKRILQILQLLEERNLTLSHCLDQHGLLLTSGFGLMLQMLGLEDGSKMKRESQCMICVIIEMLTRAKAASANDFKRLGCSMVAVRPVCESIKAVSLPPGISGHSPARTDNHHTPAPFNKPCTNGMQDMVRRYTIATGQSPDPIHLRRQFQTLQQQSSVQHDTSSISKSAEKTKRKGRMPVISPSSDSRPNHNSSLKRRAGRQLSVKTENSASSPVRKQSARPSSGSPSSTTLNLDFFTFPSESPSTDDPARPRDGLSQTPGPNSHRSNSSTQGDKPDWESLLRTFDQTNLETEADFSYEAGVDASTSPGENVNVSLERSGDSNHTPNFDENVDFLAYLDDLTGPPDTTNAQSTSDQIEAVSVDPSAQIGGTRTKNALALPKPATGKQKNAQVIARDAVGKPKSVLSLSDESLTSGEDFSSIDFANDGDSALFDNLPTPLTTVSTAEAGTGGSEVTTFDEQNHTTTMET